MINEGIIFVYMWNWTFIFYLEKAKYICKTVVIVVKTLYCLILTTEGIASLKVKMMLYWKKKTKPKQNNQITA